MPADQASPMSPAPAPDWELPEIVDVQIRAKAFRPRKMRHFDSPLTPVRDAVEIVVTLESPMPIRALGPVLYVGDAALTESQAVDEEGTQMRFWAFDRESLHDGAPISLDWSDRPHAPRGGAGAKRKAKFTYHRPG